ncbi:MAG: hypothetical protein Q8P73_03745, partial [bacterium]|nr:hypothetical protein [bacterium]
SLDSASFLRFHVGWTTEDNLAWFWFQNTGFILPAALLGLFLPLPKNVKALTLAGLAVFIIANLFLFAPWAWDNFKLLIFWLIFILPVLGWLVARYPIRKNRLLQIGITAIVFLQIASAALDIWKIALPTATTWQEWDNNAIAFAKVIKANTKAGESILTAPIHNSTVALTGRLSYLGYAAHVWSHGGDPWQREKAIEPFYSGLSSTLPETTPDYILVGPSEHIKYPNLQIQNTWQLVADSEAYQLYKLK